MSGDLSTATERQLEMWAFGRQGVVTDRELAEAALRELARRAQVARAEVARGIVTSGNELESQPSDHIGRTNDTSMAVDDATTTALRRHRRRMRTTGFAGLTAAAIALVPLVGTLTQLSGDSLAAFGGTETATDREWSERLTRDFVVAVTQGPRVFRLGDGVTAVVFRSAAVADGRSTEYDPYCLVVSTAPASATEPAFSGTCLLPEKFAVDGVSFPVRPSITGTGLDTVVWEPTGLPRLDRNAPLESSGEVRSVLDWMTFPTVIGFSDPLSFVDEPDRLLLGPANVLLNADDEATTASPYVFLSAYLLSGESPDAGPVLCANAFVTGGGSSIDETTTCASLSTVRRQGLSIEFTAEGRDWEVQLGADGRDRTDRLVAAD